MSEEPSEAPYDEYCYSPETVVNHRDPDNATVEGHDHDLWDGRTWSTIFEDDVESGDPRGAFTRFYTPDALVFLGTSLVEFSLDFTVAPTDVYKTRTLRFEMPSKSGVYFAGEIEFESSGVKNVTIKLENADPPHAKITYWRLWLNGPARVNWTIHKGYECLPVDPPHYDAWQNATELEIGVWDQTFTGRILQPNERLRYGTQKPVPHETQKLRILLSCSCTPPSQGEFLLGAEGPTQSGPEDFVGTPIAGPGPEYIAFEVPVLAEQWDSMYEFPTRWRYFWGMTNPGGDWGVVTGDLQFKVLALRIPESGTI